MTSSVYGMTVEVVVVVVVVVVVSVLCWRGGLLPRKRPLLRLTLPALLLRPIFMASKYGLMRRSELPVFNVTSVFHLIGTAQ